MASNINVNNTLEQTDTITYTVKKDSDLINTAEEKSPIPIISKKTNENEYCEVNIADDIIDTCSCIIDGIIPSIIGKAIDAFDEDTKDGQIDNTKQRATGDCWLLSGINALSYTEEGREIIKNCLEYKDGYTLVHLEGIGTYKVENKELELVKSQLTGSKQYSEGDDDMLIFELAVEKVLDDIANGDIALDPDAPWWMERKNEVMATEEGGESSTEGGSELELLYFVTGKTGEKYFSHDGMEKALLKYEENGNKDIVMTANTQEKGTALDINGNEIKITAPHAYAIKEVKDGIVTITNPHDSSKEIQFTMETFLETFYSVSFLDLSKDDSNQSLVSSEYKFDDEGNKIFIFYDKEDYQNTREVRYSPEGEPVEIVTKRNGRPVKKETYGKTNMLKVDFDPETGEETYTLKERARINSSLTLSKEEYDKVISSGILNYEQFSAEDIRELAKLTDEDLSKAIEYLQINPNATYNLIIGYLSGWEGWEITIEGYDNIDITQPGVIPCYSSI